VFPKPHSGYNVVGVRECRGPCCMTALRGGATHYLTFLLIMMLENFAGIGQGHINHARHIIY